MTLVLAQSAPSITTETDLYTVPANTETIVSSIFICNRDMADTTFRLSVAAGGGATANKDYLYYDHPLPGTLTFKVTAGITLAAGDVVRIYAGSASLSFTLNGQEAAV